MTVTLSATTTRRRGPVQLKDVATAALAAFSAGGFRLTQIAHVAERLGVSVGSIYRYVDSKEALFHIAVLESLERLPADAPLPVKTASLAQSVETVAGLIDQERLWPILMAAAGGPAPADLKAEARAIGGELYDLIGERAAFICLLDRCAQDVPELAELFDQRVRRRLLRDLITWSIHRGFALDGGRSQAEALARGAMEAVSWLAKSRPFDATARSITNAQAREAAVRIFANAYD